MAGGATFYRYVDAKGEIHLTDDVSTIPESARAKAETLDVRPVDVVPGPGGPMFVGGVHPASFAFGVAVVVSTLVIYKLVRGSSRRALKIVLTIAMIAVMASLYFGMMMQATGLGDGRLATPQEIIGETHRAVDDANKRNAEQEKVLEKIAR